METENKKILLVDDDPNFGTILRDYLAMNDYNVTHAKNGMEGFEKFKKDDYDLCILDVMMPYKDGFTLAKEIREKNIINHFEWVGNYLQEGVRNITKELGVEQMIKPFGYSVKPGFAFFDINGEPSSASRTLFLQETCARRLLMPYVVPCYSHSKSDLDFSLECIRNAVQVMKDAAEGPGMEAVLDCPEIKPVFRKYN